MKERYLEVTYRKGKPLAAYLYLPRQTDVKSVRTQPQGNGLLVDYTTGDQPIGLEITAPAQVTLEQINEVLGELGLETIEPEDLAPLLAA